MQFLEDIYLQDIINIKIFLEDIYLEDIIKVILPVR